MVLFFKNKVISLEPSDTKRSLRPYPNEPVCPQKRKKVTDGIMIIFFIIILAAIVLLSYYGLAKGRPEVFLNGVDSWGNVCGKKKNLLDSEMQTYLTIDHRNNPFEFHFKSIKSGYLSIADFLQRRTDDIVLCIESNSVSWFLKIFDIVDRYKKDILYLSCIAVIFSLGHFLMFEIVTTTMITVSCGLAGMGAVGLTFYFWFRFAVLLTLSNELKEEFPNMDFQIAVLGSKNDFWTFFGYSAFMVVLMLVVIFFLKMFSNQRKKTLGILTEASYFTCSLPSTILQPLFRLVLSFSLAGAAIYFAMHFLFLSEPFSDPDGVLRFVEKRESYNVGFLIILILGYLYVGEVLLGCQKVVMAGIFSNWFFGANDKKDANEKGLYKRYLFDRFSFVYPLGYLLRYNFGSICLASILVPPFQIGRLTFTLIYRKIRKRKNKKDRFSSSKICDGCFKGLQRFLQYISYYNYICIAMYGLNFWESGKKSASLLSKVPHFLGTKIRVDVTIFLAKVSVVFFMAFIGLMYFKTKYHFAISAEVLIPITLTCIFTYFVVSCFFNMLEVALDSMVLSYCDDMKRNNGRNRPYFARKELKDLMTIPHHRRKGWTSDTTKTSTQKDSSDSKLFCPPPNSSLHDNKRVRPKAARGKRRNPNDSKNSSPQRVISSETMCLAGPAQVLVDRFDMFVDRMMVEREKSPLNKMYKSEIQKLRGTKLPPIIKKEELLSNTVFAKIPLPDQLLLLDVSDNESNDGSKTENAKNAPIQKPVIFSIPEVQSHLSMNNPPRNTKKVFSTSTPPLRMQDLPGCYFEDEPTSLAAASVRRRKKNRSHERHVTFDTRNNPAEPFVSNGRDTEKYYGDIKSAINNA